MKNFEIKSLIIGFLIAIIFVMVCGSSAGNTSNSFAVSAPSGGFILAKAADGTAFVINEKGESKGVRMGTSGFDLAE